MILYLQPSTKELNLNFSYRYAMSQLWRSLLSEDHLWSDTPLSAQFLRNIKYSLYTITCGFGYIYWINLNGKLHFVCNAYFSFLKQKIVKPSSFIHKFHWHFLITNFCFWMVNILLRKCDTLSVKRNNDKNRKFMIKKILSKYMKI